MKVSRQINKQLKVDNIANIHDKQQTRYTKIREEVKDLNKVDLKIKLTSKNLSKTDRLAIIHTIKKIDESVITEVNTKNIIDDKTDNNSTLSGEDTNS